MNIELSEEDLRVVLNALTKAGSRAVSDSAAEKFDEVYDRIDEQVTP